MEKSRFVNTGNFVPDKNYSAWLKSIKVRLKHAQIKASVRINQSMLEFYWELGHDINALQNTYSLGSGFFEKLSLDLRNEFSGQEGYSVTNLRYIKNWYIFYSQCDTIRYQAGNELKDSMPEKFAYVPWRHHIDILRRCKNLEEALFYIDETITNGWSRREMNFQIDSNLFATRGKALSNFNEKLPTVQGELANEILKGEYKLDFLPITGDVEEKKLEDALAQNITRFLLELGSGFAYVGRQMELRIPGPDGTSFFPDMIFYHIKMKCYVVVELKVVDFVPEFAGKINFYVNAADALLKGEDDNPSIGLLICRARNKTVVEWSLKGISNPLGVATYQLQQVVDNTIAEQEDCKKK